MKNSQPTLTLIHLSSLAGMSFSFACGICSLGIFPFAFDFFRHAVEPPTYLFPGLCFFAFIKMTNATITLYQKRTYGIHWRKLILVEYYKNSLIMWLIINMLYFVCQTVFVFSALVILSKQFTLIAALLVIFVTFCVEYYLADRVYTYMLENRITVLFKKHKEKPPK